jgi:hypothetical protein
MTKCEFFRNFVSRDVRGPEKRAVAPDARPEFEWLASDEMTLFEISDLKSEIFGWKSEGIEQREHSRTLQRLAGA